MPNMPRIRKPEKKPSIREIDYLTLVDEMSDEAFRFCIEKLYPICNYRVLKPEDIRRIDLKERLLGFNSIVPKDDKGKVQGALNCYITTLKQYFDSFIKCEEESKAARYRDRAFELMTVALSDKGTQEDIDDIFLIFVSLMRALQPHFDHLAKQTVSDFTLDLAPADADLLKEIWEHKKLTPGRHVDVPDVLGKIVGADDEKKPALKLAYINNILYLARGLQNRGAFESEE